MSSQMVCCPKHPGSYMSNCIHCLIEGVKAGHSPFTPGPWFSVQYAGWFNIQSENYYSDVDNILDLECDDRAEANGKLCAAAPDLYDALIRLVADVKKKPNSSRYETHIKIAEDAINKATSNENRINHHH